jgi:hypothetical protein
MRKFLCNIIVRIKNKRLKSDMTYSSRPAPLSVLDLRLGAVECVRRPDDDFLEDLHPTVDANDKVNSFGALQA